MEDICIAYRWPVGLSAHALLLTFRRSRTIITARGSDQAAANARLSTLARANGCALTVLVPRAPSEVSDA